MLESQLPCIETSTHIPRRISHLSQGCLAQIALIVQESVLSLLSLCLSMSLSLTFPLLHKNLFVQLTLPLPLKLLMARCYILEAVLTLLSSGATAGS